ncbi:PD-(D/E)XK nuclease family protein [Thermodesulfovibrio sp. 3907-1M]|uniref:PD-(D/E)XK nuclease family protein n=1 Tax=Thermodesulfovibrio autotrophicus TaxID=3118333 RepID=A0AAU8GZW5_9BACT
MLAEIIEKIAGFEAKGSQYYPRPSLAGPERCLRQLVYMAKGIPGKKKEDRFHLILDDSSWHEELTLDWLRKSAFKVHSEQLEIECGTVKWKGRDFPLKGHIDGIITDVQGKDYLLEHKAINHFSFQRYLEKDYPLDYLTQCCLYIVGLQKLNPEINEGILLIKNKNTSQYLEFRLHYDSKNDILYVPEVCGSNGYRREGTIFKNLYNSAIERLNQIEHYCNVNDLPPRQYTLNDWQCNYCPYNEICYENYQEEFNQLEAIQLSEDYQSLLEEYEVLNEQKKIAEQRLEEIKEELKKILLNANAKAGKIGAFTITRNIQLRKQINKDKIPPELIPVIYEEKLFETLTIKKQ